MARNRIIRMVTIKSTGSNLSVEERILKSLMELHDISFKEAKVMQRMRDMTRELMEIA